MKRHPHIQAVILGILFSGHPAPARGAAAEPLVPGEARMVSPAALQAPIQIYLPSNYDPAQKWPVIFHYHGLNGQPNADVLRVYTRGRDYILVGMSYIEEGSSDKMTPEQSRAFARAQIAHFRAARTFVASAASVDASRLFMAGSSRGGWTTTLVGEAEMADLRGLLIFMAGRMGNGLPGTNPRALRDKWIYIGVGDGDPNNSPARAARVYYARNGANVTFEEYPATGHSMPDNSAALTDWLEAHGPLYSGRNTAEVTNSLVRWYTETRDRLQAIPDPLAREKAMTLFVTGPKVRLCGKDSYAETGSALARLRTQEPAATSRQTEQTYDKLLFKELTANSVEDVSDAYAGFRQLAEQHADTEFGRRAKPHVERIAVSLEALRNQVDAARKNASQPSAATPVAPNFPTYGPTRPTPPPVHRKE